MNGRIFVQKGHEDAPIPYDLGIAQEFSQMLSPDCKFSFYVTEPRVEPVIGNLRGKYPVKLGYHHLSHCLKVEGLTQDEMVISDLDELELIYQNYLDRSEQ